MQVKNDSTAPVKYVDAELVQNIKLTAEGLLGGKDITMVKATARWVLTALQKAICITSTSKSTRTA